ncbi:MAG: hypothetical protein ACRDHG_14840 [Anaerolineales bacterium]
MRPRTILLPRRALFLFIAFIFAAFLTLPAVAEYLGPDRTTTVFVEVRDPDHDVWTLTHVDPFDGLADVCLIIHTCDEHPSIERQQALCGWVADNSGCDEAYKTEEQTVLLLEATIAGVLQNCTLVNDWCTSSPTLHVTANEPVAGESITLIEGTRNGEPFACSGVVCNVPLREGSNDFTFWALSTWGDSSQMGTFSALVDSLGPTLSIPDAWYIWEPLAIGVDDGGVGIDRVKLTIDGGSFGDRSYEWSLSNLPGDFIWDRHIGEVVAPIGEYPVTVQAWDLLGNSTSAAGLILIPAPEEPEAAEEVSEPVSEPAPTEAPEDSATPIGSGLSLGATATNEPVVAALVDESAASIGPAAPATTTTSTEGGSGTLLWGAAALAAAASATAYALNRRKAREEQIERMRKEAADAASASAFAQRLSSLRAKAEAIAAPIRHSMIVAAAATQAAIELARQRAEEARRQRAEQLRAEREERAEQAERRASMSQLSKPSLETPVTYGPPQVRDRWWELPPVGAQLEPAKVPSPLRNPLGWVEGTLINAGRESDLVRRLLTTAGAAWELVGAPLVQTAGEFVVGVSYQAIKNNLEPIGWISMAVSPQLRDGLPDQVREFESGFPASTAFHAGRLFGGLVGLAESVAIWGHGGTMVGGGLVTCGTGVLCGAGAPAIAVGSLEIAAGFAVAGASLHGMAEAFSYFANRNPQRIVGPPDHRQNQMYPERLQRSLEPDQPPVPWNVNSYKRPGDVPSFEISRMKFFGKIVWTVARVIGLIETILGFGEGPQPVMPSATPTPTATNVPTSTPTTSSTPTPSHTPEPTYTSTPSATENPVPSANSTPTAPTIEPSSTVPESDTAEPHYPD